MNFVIFPMFFASSALYPLWRVQEGSPMLYYICLLNPFTHAVELIRFAFYGQIDWISLAVVAGCTSAFMIGAILPTIHRAAWSAAGPAEAKHELAYRHCRCCARRLELTSASPPIRAIRTGRARRPRCPKFRSPPCGPVRRSTTCRTNGRTTPKIGALVQTVGTADAARGSPEVGHGILAGSSDKTAQKLLFAGLFDALNAQRSSVMNGLERVMRKQREAADKICADTLALQALQGASPPTSPRWTSSAISWFGRREFSRTSGGVKFVCEVPTAIDQRLFALGPPSSRKWNSEPASGERGKGVPSPLLRGEGWSEGPSPKFEECELAERPPTRRFAPTSPRKGGEVFGARIDLRKRSSRQGV